MGRTVRAIIVSILVLALSAPWASLSAQSDGVVLCAEALAAASTGATTFQGYAIVGPTTNGQGGSGAQVVLGTAGPDVLNGGSGNDLLCGLAGDDVLLGGSGNDILVGGFGADQLSGESGGDTLYGDAADTVLDGGTGTNRQIVPIFEPGPSGATLTLTVNEINNYLGIITQNDFQVTGAGFLPNAAISLTCEPNALKCGHGFMTNANGVFSTVDPPGGRGVLAGACGEGRQGQSRTVTATDGTNSASVQQEILC